MKKSLLALLIFIFAFSVYSFADSDIEKEIKAKAKPVVQRFFDAYKAHDFEGMRKDFTQKMLSALPAKVFKDDYKKELPKYGEMTSWEYAGWTREEGFDIVLVHVAYAKGDKFQYKFVFKKGPEGKKISGLWKKPLPKGLSKVETDAMLNLYKSIMEDHLRAVKAGKFKNATENFSSGMLDKISPEKLEETIAGLNIGGLKTWKFDYAKREGEFLSFYYQADFAKGESLAYKFVFTEGAPDKKIEGLWIKPIGTE